MVISVSRRMPEKLGYRVLTATYGRQAVEVLRTNRQSTDAASSRSPTPFTSCPRRFAKSSAPAPDGKPFARRPKCGCRSAPGCGVRNRPEYVRVFPPGSLSVFPLPLPRQIQHSVDIVGVVVDVEGEP
jgi:hypothetical protein